MVAQTRSGGRKPVEAGKPGAARSSASATKHSPTTVPTAARSSQDTPSRARTPRGGLDPTDVQLIELLAHDGRLGNRELGRRVGLTEVTVAGRIQTLIDRRILGVTAVVDWRAAGYSWDVWLQMTTDSGSVYDVGRDVADIDSVQAVYVVFGPFDLIVHAVFRGRDEAVEFLNQRIATIRGLADVRTSMTLETLKYSYRYSRISSTRRPPQFPNPTIPIDDLDHAIVNAVVTDGRQSNRAIARSLGVAEGTIRVRLRRMENAGLLRIVGQSDPYLAGTISAWAVMGLVVEPGRRRAIAEQLRDLDETTIVTTTTGQFDIIACLAASSRLRLTELGVEVVRTLPGVTTTQTWEIVRTSKGPWNLASLV